MRELPAGTVTFLFTDIEGSTRLLHELGAERYANSLAGHRRALREAFAAHGGVEVDTQGDAFFVAFGDAGEALAASREAQEALEGPIRIRMGLHTGTPLLTDEGYVGVDVHKAARICSAGHGGQILVSEQTKLVVGDDGLCPLGAHRLKDLTEPEPLYQVGEVDFPPLKSLNQSNLPVQPTPFLGREKELGELLGLLRQEKTRLLTLTGPGGSGKTRLATQAAAEVVDEHEHGVWWVSLQAVHDPELVAPAIAATIGASGGDVAAHVANRRMLLLLDNFEQVVDASPALGELLAACPNLSLLVTSREPLHLAAEQEYPVPPFVEQEAVGFFFSRARAIRPDFADDGAVRPICRRLDYLPLALELAAARVKALAPEQILERLEQSLPLLTGGARDAPERQRTLRATIGWSYDLLAPEEQRLFRALSVFAGGFTVAAAEEVAGAEVDTLQSLVDKSLLRFEGERYSMLETIREFARERLEESGEAADVDRRHAGFFLALGEVANMSAEGDYGRRYDILPPEQDNLRAVVDWSLAAGEIELGLRLAVALENFWVITDPFEGMRRFEELLARADGIDPILRARALRCYSGSCHISGHREQAERAIEESLALFKKAGDEEGVAVLLHRRGVALLARGDSGAARGPLEESLALFRRTGSRRGEGEAIGSLGYVERAEGNLERAIELYEESAAIVGPLGFTWWRLGMLAELAECELELGRPDDAAPRASESLALAIEIGDRQGTVFSLAILAWIAVEKGELGRAGRLWGAIEAEEERRPIGAWESHREEYAARLQAHIGPELEAGVAEGRQLPLEAAVAEALGLVSGRGSARRANGA